MEWKQCDIDSLGLLLFLIQKFKQCDVLCIELKTINGNTMFCKEFYLQNLMLFSAFQSFAQENVKTSCFITNYGFYLLIFCSLLLING